MPSLPSYPDASIPLGNTDRIYLEQGNTASRSKKATVQMLMDKFTPPVAALVTTETNRALAAERRLESRDFHLSLYHFITSSIADGNPLGSIAGPAASITEANTAPVEVVLGDNSAVEPCFAWYSRYDYHNPSGAIDPIIMTPGGFGMKSMADALPVGTAAAYGTDKKFMMYGSQSVDRVVVATDGAHHNNAMSRVGILLPETAQDTPMSLPDELLIRFTRAFTANVLDSFTVSLHRPGAAGNFSVVLPLSDLSSFDTGATVAVRARRAAGGYNWKIDAWQEA